VWICSGSKIRMRKIEDEHRERVLREASRGARF
jgi:hypothetical protein